MKNGSRTGYYAAISASTPTFASLSGKPTTLNGYGITDAYTKTEVGTIAEFDSTLAAAMA